MRLSISFMRLSITSMCLSITFMLVLLFAPIAFPATIFVPDDYASIQSAIQGAASGDTIEVRPGTYLENIDFIGKNLVVQSEMGPAVTVIDGGQQGSVVSFVNREVDAVIQGFTITNGNGTPGGSGREGGGIRCVNESSALVSGNIITGNQARYGGGIMAAWAIEVRDNLITANTVNSNGAGIFITNTGSIVIEGNEITENVSNYSGGGIELYRGTYGLIKNNIIANNEAATGGGAGIRLQIGSAVIMYNNMIHDNSSSGRGGGMHMTSYCQALMVNNTLCSNATNNSGGGIACRNFSHVTIVNSILWNNTAAGSGNEILLSSVSQPSHCAVSYSNLCGGLDSVSMETNCTMDWGVEMLDAAPGFLSATEGDFHLTQQSPCINRGTSWNAPLVDFENEARPVMGKVDLGADEYSGLHTLEAGVFALPLTGGSVVFSLHAGGENAGRTYLLTGGLSGTSPGFPLPGGQVSIPVNFDDFTFLTVFPQINTAGFQNFMGTLPADGSAMATLNSGPLPPSSSGLRICLAYCLNWPFDFASNPVEIEVTSRN